MASPQWMQNVVPTRFDNDVFPFWDGLKEHKFLLHRCRLSGRYYWPMAICPDADEGGLADMEWTPTSGRGTVYAWGVVHRANDPAFKAETPYAVVLVELEEGPIFPSRIAGKAPEDLHIGMAVEVHYEDVEETGMTLPLFKPVR